MKTEFKYYLIYAEYGQKEINKIIENIEALEEELHEDIRLDGQISFDSNSSSHYSMTLRGNTQEILHQIHSTTITTKMLSLFLYRTFLIDFYTRKYFFNNPNDGLECDNMVGYLYSECQTRNFGE
jgi:hypothetical protein